jgi:P4 family phage/plasmid primase-like protien
MTPRDAAREYVARGWAAIPVPRGSKNPAFDGWQDLRLTAADVDAYFGGDVNVGLVLGAASGGLTDVDLDAGEAVVAADVLLPPTAMVHGRPGKPRSHRWYVATPVAATKKFLDTDRSVLVEVRSTGHQTIVPPSVHTSGERVAWVGQGLDPAPVDGAQLIGAASRVAAAAILARRWSSGSRHETALAVAGVLLRGGWAEPDAELFLEAVARAADDDDVADRVRAVAYTASRIKANQPATGIPSLGDLVGEAVAARVLGWLGLRSGGAARVAVVAPGEPFALSDMGNAHRYARLCADDLRYCPDMGTWLFWDGRRWAPDSTGESVRRTERVVRSLLEEAAQAADPAQKRATTQWALASQAEFRIRAMVKLAQSVDGVPVMAEQLDADPWLFNVANGTIDLKTGELLPHNRADLLTKIAPVVYDPNARHAVWHRFLARVLPDPDVRAFAQRVAGYGLTASTREQCMFLAYGGTASGKSTFLDALMAAVGDYSNVVEVDNLMESKNGQSAHKEYLARLHGARLVCGSEIERGKRIAEALVKNLTGEDIVTARHMYRATFQFRPTFKILIAVNDRPHVRDDDDAIWRRLHLLPFPVSIPPEERDPLVRDTLVNDPAARAAVLAWAVEGCLEWQRGGLRPPPTLQAEREHYRAEMDPLQEFLVDRCVDDPALFVPTETLYGDYVQWAKTSGEKYLLTRRFMVERLKKKGVTVTRFGPHFVYCALGIGLRGPDGSYTPSTASSASSASPAQNGKPPGPPAGFGSYRPISGSSASSASSGKTPNGPSGGGFGGSRKDAEDAEDSDASSASSTVSIKPPITRIGEFAGSMEDPEVPDPPHLSPKPRGGRGRAESSPGIEGDAEDAEGASGRAGERTDPPPVWGCPRCGQRAWEAFGAGTDWCCTGCLSVWSAVRAVGERVYPTDGDGNRAGPATTVTSVADGVPGTRWCAIEGTRSLWQEDRLEPLPPC